MSILYKSAGSTLAAFTTANIIEYRMNQPDEIEPPVDTVSIIMPSYNEEQFIKSASESVRNQSIISEYPDKFEFILVDSGSTDNTVELAKPYVDRIIISPRGKLTARNLGTDKSRGNIIVSIDSDTVYNPHWLNALLKPFNNSDIVGVVGSTSDNTIPHVPKSIYILSSTVWAFLNPTRMIGRNCAYYKHLFYLTGKFNENLNQQNMQEDIREEEYEFGKRLSGYGNIVFRLNASCAHLGGFKVGCRLGLSNKRACADLKMNIERMDNY